MRTVSIAALTALFTMGFGVSAVAAPSAIATIVTDRTEGGLKIVGRATALSDGEYKARVKVEKSGSGGATNTTQGRTVELMAGGEAEIATIGLSFAAGDRLTVEMEIESGGKIVATSVLDIGGDRGEP